MIITIIIVFPFIGHLLCVDICCGVEETEWIFNKNGEIRRQSKRKLSLSLVFPRLQQFGEYVCKADVVIPDREWLIQRHNEIN